MITLLRRFALSLLLGAVFAGPALAQTDMRRLDRDPSARGVPDAPGGMSYETDGNAKTPRAVQNPDVPAYQRGSGQETGGPARELIARF